ncbi:MULTISPECIES: MBL fold metallo-hydrolase [unclassified Mycolicibacterium]|uniref:MBL fold metallo-hydrolase n=1 Tax=unclassified Mycolicibacterium TaxID=2636767 RepID=UPI0012DCC676|nr:MULTISPECIES: MBL fold metallo-hydrolase [unclassified Mycolicibacterium]MUL85798.1 MBL fold metallo-hydrolase [Mycolicibacterium sp. CBMA 329]MUL90168.1 MBL fold metallo-hydrolase [Mycolicibacterium sp. CBMA 331]MUM00937.1 MBL fold metallo-hydrolase [Mycolicibacterium sp. CBMA 334]MUM27477.1 MBL fold metallo-hydrolase [Mycolicibacterium sp. CBMA 295]MUM39683.1 MBL fold metallo-hydrolase [Mycolicibacterium sp. CBMA 247]
MTTTLGHQLFVSGQLPQSGRGPLPDGSTRMWSPITSTLITGTREAVLVDPPMTNTQAAEVGEWIEASGHRLRGIYITHGHGDHWFGAIPLLQRFPDAVVYATAGTVQHMAAQNSPEFRASFWDTVFPGQLPAGDIDVSVVNETGFALEGERLVPVEVGHTDTDATTVLYVPAISLLVAGDAVYNGVHPYLTESGGVAGIDAWLAALEVVDALRPATVIAGHKNRALPDGPSQLDATRRYLTDARRLLESSTGAEEFYTSMLALHPDRINPGALWGAAITLFPPDSRG